MSITFTHSRLLTRRKELNLTQEEVARLADVSGTTYVQMEAGNKVPLVTTFARVAQALSKPPSYFFTEQPAPGPKKAA